MTGSPGEQRGRNLVFVVGVGRSGTSLLQSMLNAHPAICFPPETAFLRRYLASGMLERLYGRYGADRVVTHLAADDMVSRLGFTLKQLGAIVARAEEAFTGAKLYELLLRQYAARKASADWIGDKDPRSIEYLPVIHRFFPGAVVLHIIRDPRDVLASKKKAAWSRNRTSLLHVFANRVQLKTGRRLGRELFGDRYHELTYEELISRPEAALTSICSLLALQFHPAMLDFAASSKELVTEREMQWKKETLGPLLSSNSGKWQNSLKTWETALVERVCREAFDVAGYRSSHSARKLSLMRRTAILPLAILFPVLDIAYRRYKAWKLCP
jgi:hypothetical protein